MLLARTKLSNTMPLTGAAIVGLRCLQQATSLSSNLMAAVCGGATWLSMLCASTATYFASTPEAVLDLLSPFAARLILTQVYRNCSTQAHGHTAVSYVCRIACTTMSLAEAQALRCCSKSYMLVRLQTQTLQDHMQHICTNLLSACRKHHWTCVCMQGFANARCRGCCPYKSHLQRLACGPLAARFLVTLVCHHLC